MAPAPRPLLHLVLSSLGLVVLLACAGAASAAPRVGVVGPNVLVRPADAPATTATARLLASGNEFESVQVVARAEGAALTGLDVAVTGQLKAPGGATIPASAFTIYRVGYYDVTGLPSDGDLGGALGAFPDSLIPKVDTIWGEARNAFPIDVPAGQNRLAWIDVLVPAGQQAGVYSGASIRVTASGGFAQSIPVEVEVVDLDLPSSTTLDGGFDFNPNQLCRVHACGSYPGGSTALAAMYARVALDDRLTLAKPPNSTPSGPGDASYRTYTRPLLTGTGTGTRLRGAKLRTVTIYQWAVESADEWRRTAEADGFVDRVRFHCDEIATSVSAWSKCRSDWTRANALWRGAATGAVTDLPLQVTTSIDDVAWARANGFGDLADRIAVLIPVINRVHPKSRPAFPGRRAEFAPWTTGTTPGGAVKQLWSYTSCMSMGCSPASPDLESEWRGWPSYGVDQPAMQARAMGWISWTYALGGEYYYETTRDLPGAWTNLWSADGGNHGDGTLFYPGTVAKVGGVHDVAIESIRLKRIRDGREDYEWLRVAADAVGRARVEGIARGAFASAHATDIPQAQLDGARRELADLVGGRAVRDVVVGGEDTLPAGTGGGAGSGGSGSGAGAGTGGSGSGAGAGTGGGAGAGTGGSGAAPGTETGAGGGSGGGSANTPGGSRVPAGVTPPRVTCGGRRATIVGTARADVLRGTRGVDVIAGLGGNDRIVGFGGADIICGGPGNDVISTGNDSRASDMISCGSGRDRLVHDASDRVLAGCERRLRTR